jgi:putative ubiquitin-RnfH superfamily antitoxin RatB of RatAB toxin-antitoxin module
MASAPDAARVEVAYALPDRQLVIEVPLADGMTALQAVEAAGILADTPELAARPLCIGIFGKLVESSQVLKPGDRVEIYRPLPDDPRERRRRLAAQGASAGRQRTR